MGFERGDLKRGTRLFVLNFSRIWKSFAVLTSVPTFDFQPCNLIVTPIGFLGRFSFSPNFAQQTRFHGLFRSCLFSSKAWSACMKSHSTRSRSCILKAYLKCTENVFQFPGAMYNFSFLPKTKSPPCSHLSPISMRCSETYKTIFGGGSRIGAGRFRSYFDPPGAVGGRYGSGCFHFSSKSSVSLNNALCNLGSRTFFCASNNDLMYNA